MNIKNSIWKFNYKKRALLSSYCYSKNFISLPYPPIEVFIEPTNHCNLKCIICPHGKGLTREKGSMSMETFNKVLKEVVSAGVLKATMNFAGEPLLNKNIFEMIKLAKKNNLFTRIHTNATVLSQDLAGKIIESGLDEFSFSFDDPRKDVYEKIRAGASYEKTLDAIRMFLELKKKLNSKKPYTIVQRIKLNQFNYDGNEDCECRKLFTGLAVDKFHTIVTHNWAGTCQDSFIEKYDAFPRKSPCRVIWSRFAIGWNGLVFACCNEMNGKLLVGDLNTAGLLDIWNGFQMKRLRQIMLDAKYNEVEACRYCDVLSRVEKKDTGILKTGLARLFLLLHKI